MDLFYLVPGWCVHWGIILVSIFSFLLGILSGFRPTRSIDLYVWLMSKFNWHATPIDEEREIRNTRRFGLCLVVLGAMMVFLLVKLKQ